MSEHKEVRFPDDISYGSVGGPEFSTNVAELSSGKEQRVINWSESRNRYNVSYSVKSDSQFAVLLDFFYSHKGKALPFRFKDWVDYTATEQNIGIGTGQLLDFQLVKQYSSTTNSYTRLIRKPVKNTVALYLDSLAQTYGKDYSVNFSNGLVTFKKPPAPKASITATFEFDVYVRFDTDFLPFSLDGYGNYSCNHIPLIEVKDTL